MTVIMNKAIYLIKAKGYSYFFTDGSKRTYTDTINYHCCTTLKEAQNDVLRWRKEERLENKINVKEGRMQIWHNYQIEILDLYGD